MPSLPLQTLLGIIAVLCSLARPALAHEPFEITAQGRVSAEALTLVATMTRGSGLHLIEPQRAPGTALAPDDLPRLRERFEAAGSELFELQQSARTLSPRSVAVRLTVERELEFSVVYPLPAPGALTIRAAHLRRLTREHACAINVIQDSPSAVLGTAVLTQEAPAIDVRVLTTGPTSVESRAERPQLALGSMFELGVEHILTGYDHLLFLAALLVASRSLRSLVMIVTSFTLAHSLALAASWLGVLAPPAAIIEPLILASIVFVGIENLVQKGEPRARGWLSFGFGVIHGFGFAGALRELGLGGGPASLVSPLLGFNLGVEAGQLAVIALSLPLLRWLRRRDDVARYALTGVSVLVTVLGGYWMLHHFLSGGS